jgi:hypothetical protein
MRAVPLRSAWVTSQSSRATSAIGPLGVVEQALAGLGRPPGPGAALAQAHAEIGLEPVEAAEHGRGIHAE